MKPIASTAPHIRSGESVQILMGRVLLALTPALLAGIARFGGRALAVALVSVIAAVIAEWLCCRLCGKANTTQDCSAAVTGLLLALTLPASVPLWQVAFGAGFAIVAVKQACGGLGENPFNPALCARALMLLLFPASITRYTAADGLSTATPLHSMVLGALPDSSIADLLLGRRNGSIGEICALALLIGGGFLLLRRVISPRIPTAYLSAVALIAFLFPVAGSRLEWMLYNLLGGGVLLGAFFMATDYATSPVTPRGQWLYGAGCGALTMLFRRHSLFPEGVTYAILTMNALVWSIDRHTAPRRFGVKKGASA